MRKLSKDPRAVARRAARAAGKKKSSKAARPIHDYIAIDSEHVEPVRTQRNVRAAKLSMASRVEMLQAENAQLKRAAEQLSQDMERATYDVGCIESGQDAEVKPPQPETRLSLAVNGLVECNKRLHGLCESLVSIADRQLGPTDKGSGLFGPCRAGTLGQLDDEVSTFFALLDVLDATMTRLAQV